MVVSSLNCKETNKVHAQVSSGIGLPLSPLCLFIAHLQLLLFFLPCLLLSSTTCGLLLLLVFPFSVCAPFSLMTLSLLCRVTEKYFLHNIFLNNMFEESIWDFFLMNERKTKSNASMSRVAKLMRYFYLTFSPLVLFFAMAQDSQQNTKCWLILIMVSLEEQQWASKFWGVRLLKLYKLRRFRNKIFKTLHQVSAESLGIAGKSNGTILS